jgi:hypothetical protein
MQSGVYVYSLQPTIPEKCTDLSHDGLQSEYFPGVTCVLGPASCPRLLMRFRDVLVSSYPHVWAKCAG